MELHLCEECGEELHDAVEICLNCGCPVSVSEKEPEMETVQPQQVELTGITIPLFKKKAFWASIIGCIILIAGLLIGVKVYKNKQAEKYAETYYANM